MKKSNSRPAYAQRTVEPVFAGNRKKDFFPPSVQRKLAVGESGDKYEKEADVFADKVVQRLNIPDKSNTKETDVKKSSSLKVTDQKCAQCEKDLQKKDKDLEDRKEIQNLQRKPIFESREELSGNESLQKKENSRSDTDTDSSIESRLSHSKGSGSQLPSETNRSMSDAFGRDFSNVRIHTDSSAAQMSEDLNAQAFTHGSDIYFNSGKFSTTSPEGRHLIAHELTHTIQQGNNIRRELKNDSAGKEELKSAKEADPAELESNKLTKGNHKGFITRKGKTLEIHLDKLLTKKYLTEGDTSFLTLPIKLPRASAQRKTRQIQIWKSNVREKVEEHLKKNYGKEEPEGDLSLTVNKRKQTGAIGNLKQITGEAAIPFWSSKGQPKVYDVEHMVDWQIAGDKADVIENLILLDRAYNRSLGNEVREAIQNHIETILKHYKKNYKGIPISADSALASCNVLVDEFKFEGKKLDDEMKYVKDLISEKGDKTFDKTKILVKNAKIPDGMFLLKTSESRAGYLIPYNRTEEIGAWKITSKFDDKKEKKLISLIFEIVVKDPKKVLEKRTIEAGSSKVKKLNMNFDEEKNLVYKIKPSDLKQQYGAAFKEMYGEAKDMSPIQLNEPEVDGLDVSLTGKIIPTLSFLKDVDIDFGIVNGEFYINAEVPLPKVAAAFPKPFKVDTCSIIISASSVQGLSVYGDIGFSLGKFGEGEISAGVSNKVGVFLDGSFNFTSKWFNPAMIKVGYRKGDWSIGGKIGVQNIKGIKSAELEVGYSKGNFSAKGNAELTVPGVKSVVLTADIDDKGNFAFGAEVALEKLPGVKSGDINITIKSKEGQDDISLRAEGKAIPDFPGIKDLSGDISIIYEDGLFDARLKINYKKGRFDGVIEIGVTNRTVDDKGKPIGEPTDKGDTVLFGFGSLTVELFKGIKGTITVRLTPEGNLLITGEIEAKDLTPFGQGYNIEKELVKFPRITIPLVGIPGLSISAFIDGGVYFKFSWQPLVLKQLKVSFQEININEIENVTIDIHGSVGSKADAEVYMTINAGLEARVAVATLSGSIGGEAGLGVSAEAGGELDADWNKDKGLQLKEIRAFVNVTPRAVFRLTGKVSVDIDLWITTINLYSKKYVFADKALDLSGLTLKLDFPIKFDENNNVIMPPFDKINLERPDFSGSAGRDILDKAINGDAQKELEEKKQKIKAEIRYNLREKSKDEDFSYSEYTEDMVEKYGKSDELKEFVLKTIEEESRSIEYERFSEMKAQLRGSEIPLQSKLNLVNILAMYNRYITSSDIQAFKGELERLEEDKRLKTVGENMAASPPSDAKNSVSPVQKRPIPGSEPEDKYEKANSSKSPSPDMHKSIAAGTDVAQNSIADPIYPATNIVQRVPQAGYQLPSTPRMSRWYGYRDEVVDINRPTFKPGVGLGNYIAALWENMQEAPVNVKFGAIAEGFIYVKPSAAPIISQLCVQGPVGKLLGISICTDIPPSSHNYNAVSQIIPLRHSAFRKSEKGSPVLLVRIINGFITGKLGWIEGKKPDEIDPLMDAASVRTDENVFLPLIFGNDYDGTNHISIDHTNDIIAGSLFYHSIGILKLPNEQQIHFRFQLQDATHKFIAELIGQPKGLNEYKAPVLRDPDGLLTAETPNLELDVNWTSGKSDDEDGEFTAKQFRLSYRNGVLEIYGNASYTSPRISGEVNIAVTQLSKSKELFETHAPGEKIKGPVGLRPDAGADSTEEPLALTAWGNLSFNIIDVDETKVLAGGGKTSLEDLKGEAAFVVSHDGYIILSGKLKFPTKWKLTEPLKYNSADATGDDKHFFEHNVDVVEAPVPYGTVALKFGITVDADAALDPLELYEIEVSGVYSNHPEYRSEINITPRFYISGNAGAKVMVSAEGGYKLGGLFTLGSISGNIQGTARANAYIDAAPSVKKIWNDPEKPAAYGISGIIHTGGQLTFKLSGTISVKVLKAKIWETEDYTIGSWTLGGFGVVLEMKDYIIGSGNYPDIDYKKMGFTYGQRWHLGNAIAREKEASGTPDKRTGGFKQQEGRKTTETGTFSTTPPARPDHNKDPLDTDIEEDFLMMDNLHELIITIGGTRENPTVKLEMSSGDKKPLEEKIASEKDIIAVEKTIADPVEDKQLDSQLADLSAIETEAKAVEKNAKGTALKVEKEAEPVIAGFDQLDDRISSYGNKYQKNDLGINATPKTIPAAPFTPATLRVPKSNGASGKMEQLLMEKRMEAGASTFEDFKGSNVAVFRYYVLKPTANQIDASADGPFYDWAENQSKGLHSEQIVAGQLQAIQSSRAFRKKYGPDYKIAVDQILTERSPCGMCSNFLNRNKSSLIIVTNYHTFYLVHYSGSWIKRNRALMIKYGLQPPSYEELQKKYGGRDLDPH